MMRSVTWMMALLMTTVIGCKTVPEAPEEQPLPPAEEPSETTPTADDASRPVPEGGDDFGSPEQYGVGEEPPPPRDGEAQTVYLELALDTPEHIFLQQWGEPDRTTEFKHGERETLVPLEPRLMAYRDLLTKAGHTPPAIETHQLREDVWIRDGYEFHVWSMLSDLRWSGLTAASVRTP